MTRDEIIRMAREAGAVVDVLAMGRHDGVLFTPLELERFARLVAEAEREECIALYYHEDVQAPVGNSAWGEARQEGWIEGTTAYRDAIRARGEKGQS